MGTIIFWKHPYLVGKMSSRSPNGFISGSIAKVSSKVFQEILALFRLTSSVASRLTQTNVFSKQRPSSLATPCILNDVWNSCDSAEVVVRWYICWNLSEIRLDMLGNGWNSHIWNSTITFFFFGIITFETLPQTSPRNAVKLHQRFPSSHLRCGHLKNCASAF